MIEHNPNAWYGCRRDTKDARDHMFTARSGLHLSAPVDLRSDCPPVMDQGDLGSCTANAITAVLRYEMIRTGHPDVPLSRLQLYYDERAMEGTIRSDAGAEIRNGIKCAGRIGVGHENLWAYNIRRYWNKPNPAVYADAVKFKALAYQRVEVDIDHIKAALAQRHPVIIGLTLYDSFDSDQVTKTGIVPMPKLTGPKDQRDKITGGHCMYAWGHSQHPGYFSVRNSWNTDWGDKGDCYFPFAYLGSKLFGSDYWIITSEGAQAK